MLVNFGSFGVVLCLMMACSPPVTISLDADGFENKINETPNPQLVDVRTFEEYRAGYLVGAMLMDVRRTTFQTQIQRLDRERPVFVYCRSGRRSLDAAKILERNDFKVVYNLKGGINEWIEKGKAVELR